MTPMKAFRLALETAVNEGMTVPVGATGGSRGVADPDEVLDALSDDGLIALLTDREGHYGALWLDFAALSAIVEAQTIGRISAKAPEMRGATATDAAIIAPLLDDFLAKFGTHLAPEEEGYWAGGYIFVGRLPDRRALGLVMAGMPHQLFQVPLDLGLGTRLGKICLALPVYEPPEPRVPAPAEPEGQLLGPILCERLMDMPTGIDAVLFKLEVPLGKFSRLRVGDILHVPQEALRRTRMEVFGGVQIAQGQLGQLNGQRAVRLVLQDERYQADAELSDLESEQMLIEQEEIGPDTPDRDLSTSGGWDRALENDPAVLALSGEGVVD